MIKKTFHEPSCRYRCLLPNAEPFSSANLANNQLVSFHELHSLPSMKIYFQISSKVMQPFSTSYKKAINQQQGRVGPVFQGPFKSKRIDKNEYLLQLSRYIHLNPVIAGMVRLPEEWEYSSYLDYIGKRTGMVLNWDIILSQFIPFLPKNLQETSKESSLQKAQQAYQAFVVEGDNSLDLPEILLLN